MERNLRTRRLLLCGLSVFFLFSWISFVFSTLIGDIKLFQASARQASYISGDLIVGSFNAWELKSVLSRALSYFLYKIAVLFFPFGTYAYECVCKGVYSVLLLLDVFLSVKLVFGKDREKVLWSFLAVSCLFMASAIDCHMQVEMTGSLLILLAFSLYWNAVRHEKFRILKLLASGMLIGAVFYFKSILLLLSVSVVAAVCIFLLENRMKLSLRRMMTVVAGSLLSLAILTLLVYLVNPSEFREIMNAAEYQGTFWKPRIMLRKSLLAFLAGHAEKPAFTPALWIGFVCLVMNLIRCIREKEKLHYDTEQLGADVRKQVNGILSGDTDSEVFYKNILDHMVVYKDCHVEVRLNLLPMKWVFVLERLSQLKGEISGENAPENTGCKNDTEISGEPEAEKSEENQGFPAPVCNQESSVPISVSSACTWG